MRSNKRSHPYFYRIIFHYRLYELFLQEFFGILLKLCGGKTKNHHRNSQMTPKEKLIQAIERSPDSIVQELLKLLESLEQKQLKPELVDSNQKTVLERMGGVPKYLLNIGDLSDRDRRREEISSYLQKKYRQD